MSRPMLPPGPVPNNSQLKLQRGENEDNSICENETKEAENEKVARCPGADNFDIILYSIILYRT